MTPDKENQTDQIYAYRLLCSEDAEIWKVIYDTADDNTKYKKGWQTFKLDKPVDARYIRIHAIHNKKNSGFHVVRLHVFQQKNTLYDSQDLFLCTGPFDQEIGDAYPMSYQLLDLSGRIQNITEEQNSTAFSIPDPSLKQRYHEVIDYLFEITGYSSQAMSARTKGKTSGNVK